MLGLFIRLVSKLFFFTGYVGLNSSFPEPLSKEEEKQCLEAMAGGDSDARAKLIEHNLRLVAHIAKKYASPKRDTDDLISIGTVGLIKAVSTFNSEKSKTLAAYAARCIENEILMSLRSEKKQSGEVYLMEPIGTDNDGNKYMKFPQEYDPASVIRTLLFGQYSSERGQEYIDSGFKRLSADETAAMEKAENFGIPKNEFYDLVLGLKEYKKDAEKREALLANDNFTAKEKYIHNSLILEGNGTKPQYILDRAIFNPGLEKDTREALNAGITKDRFYEEIIGLKNYGSQEKKQEALFGESGLDAYQKGVIDRILIGGEKTRDYTDA